MAVDWNLYERLLKHGLAEDTRENSINEATTNFTEGIVDDPAYQEAALVNGVTTPIVASRTSTIECELKAVPGTKIHIGDMVDCYDETWIVVELYVDQLGIINGLMWLCNNVIRFQNRSPKVHAYYCVVDDGTYSNNSTDPIARIPENTYKVYMTIDENTEQIYIDKRFALGNIYSAEGERILEVYKTAGVDFKSKNFGKGSHLMIITLKRDVYHPETDSLEQMLCDIYNEAEDIVISAPAGTCAISGRDNIRIGTTRKYTASFYDENGNDITDSIVVNWDVIAPQNSTFNVYDNICVIELPLKDNLVGEIITMRVADESGNYGICEKKVQVITVG